MHVKCHQLVISVGDMISQLLQSLSVSCAFYCCVHVEPRSVFNIINPFSSGLLLPLEPGTLPVILVKYSVELEFLCQHLCFITHVFSAQSAINTRQHTAYPAHVNYSGLLNCTEVTEMLVVLVEVYVCIVFSCLHCHHPRAVHMNRSNQKIHRLRTKVCHLAH